MATVFSVCDFYVGAINTAYNAAGITTPGIIITGWPQFEDLNKAMQAGQVYVSVWPCDGDRNVTRFLPEWQTQTQVTPTLTATVALGAKTITFSGTAGQVGLNVHVVVSVMGQRFHYDARYATLGTDTLNSIATSVAAAINAASIPGVTAAAVGAVVTITGSIFNLVCNVGGTATLAREARRHNRHIQVTTWAPNGNLRQQIDEIVRANFGLATVPWLGPLADGSYMRPWFIDGGWHDESTIDNCFRADSIFATEFVVYETVPATAIGTIQMPGLDPAGTIIIP